MRRAGSGIDAETTDPPRLARRQSGLPILDVLAERGLKGLRRRHVGEANTMGHSPRFSFGLGQERAR